MIKIKLPLTWALQKILSQSKTCAEKNCKVKTSYIKSTLCVNVDSDISGYDFDYAYNQLVFKVAVHDV